MNHEPQLGGGKQKYLPESNFFNPGEMIQLLLHRSLCKRSVVLLRLARHGLGVQQAEVSGSCPSVKQATMISRKLTPQIPPQNIPAKDESKPLCLVKATYVANLESLFFAGMLNGHVEWMTRDCRCSMQLGGSESHHRLTPAFSAALTGLRRPPSAASFYRPRK